jgi:hypothetical protein
MLNFRHTLDPYSIAVMRDDARIVANLSWHPGKPPRVVTWGEQSFTLSELAEMADKLRAVAFGGDK